MLRKTKKGFYVLEKFASIPNLLHGFSTIDFGNVSFVYDKRQEVLENRARFAQEVGVDPVRLVSVHQKHGAKILIISPGSSVNQTEEIIADGLMTDQKNVGLLIKTADCLPLLLYDPENEVIGLIHVGRQGLALQIHERALTILQKKFSTRLAKLMVGFGPAICGRCYHGKIDLAGAVSANFFKKGIKRENLFQANVCPFENHDFYSHQRSQRLGEPEARGATLYAIKGR